MRAPARAALVEWWASGVGGPAAYAQSRSVGAARWSAATAGLPAYAGPEAVPPPDRAPPMLADAPEILAFRALMQDRGTAMDTSTRRIRALTQAAQELEQRPLQWSADVIGGQCARLAEEGAGVWALLEAVREFWDWHPDGRWVAAQRERMAALLAVVAGPAESADA